MKFLDKDYIKEYKKLFYEILKETNNNHDLNETGIRSYTHQNSLMSYVFWKRLDVALEIAKVEQGSKVLDFGAGGGVLFSYLNKLNCHIVACENEHFNLTKKIAEGMNIKIDIIKNIFTIQKSKFDYIFALDVLEHVDHLEKYLIKFQELSNSTTKIIISGPTESFFYKIGRYFAGFNGDYHQRDIFEIENSFKKLKYKKENTIILKFPFSLFRISSWFI